MTFANKLTKIKIYKHKTMFTKIVFFSFIYISNFRIIKIKIRPEHFLIRWNTTHDLIFWLHFTAFKWYALYYEYYEYAIWFEFDLWYKNIFYHHVHALLMWNNLFHIVQRWFEILKGITSTFVIDHLMNKWHGLIFRWLGFQTLSKWIGVDFHIMCHN